MLIIITMLIIIITMLIIIITMLIIIIIMMIIIIIMIIIVGSFYKLLIPVATHSRVLSESGKSLVYPKTDRSE